MLLRVCGWWRSRNRRWLHNSSWRYSRSRCNLRVWSDWRIIRRRLRDIEPGADALHDRLGKNDSQGDDRRKYNDQ
ncbi:MAG: hypothetical protein WBW99_04185 [Pseudolabrys sp.]